MWNSFTPWFFPYIHFAIFWQWNVNVAHFSKNPKLFSHHTETETPNWLSDQTYFPIGIIQWVDKSDRASISGLTVSISATQVALAAFLQLRSCSLARVEMVKYRSDWQVKHSQLMVLQCTITEHIHHSLCWILQRCIHICLVLFSKIIAEFQ